MGLSRNNNGAFKENEGVLPDVKSEDFAEFYGIMLGDGCLYSNGNGLNISSDALLDKEYITVYVPQLINRLFRITPKIYPSYGTQGRVTRCIIYNRKIVKFMYKCGFPLGNKKAARITIPEYFFSNPKLLKRCLKGMHDTDGSVCPHPNAKIMTDLTIKIPSLLESAVEGFIALGMKFSHSKKAIFFYGADNVKNYFDKIGSSNEKHIIKFDVFTLTGHVPRSKEMERFLRDYYDGKVVEFEPVA